MLTACIAVSYVLLKYTEFGDQYYITQLENESRRFGFALSLAFAMQATFGLVARPKEPTHWVGLRVALGFGTVLALRYTLLPNDIVRKITGDPNYAASLENWFFVVPLFLVGSTCLAVVFANYNVFWGGALALPMIAELSICLLFMVIAQTPKPLWDLYLVYRDFDIAVLSLGFIAVAILGFLSIRDDRCLAGVLASFTFITVSICTRLYEQFLL